VGWGFRVEAVGELSVQPPEYHTTHYHTTNCTTRQN
jgi:hypothetical protein